MQKDALVDALNKAMARVTPGKVSCVKATIERAQDELNRRNGNDTGAPYSTEAVKTDIDDLMTNGEEMKRRVASCKLSATELLELRQARD